MLIDFIEISLYTLLSRHFSRRNDFSCCFLLLKSFEFPSKWRVLPSWLSFSDISDDNFQFFRSQAGCWSLWLSARKPSRWKFSERETTRSTLWVRSAEKLPNRPKLDRKTWKSSTEVGRLFQFESLHRYLASLEKMLATFQRKTLFLIVERKLFNLFRKFPSRCSGKNNLWNCHLLVRLSN